MALPPLIIVPQLVFSWRYPAPTALPPRVPLLAAKEMKKWYQNHGHHWPDHEPGLVSGDGEEGLLIENSISHPLGDKILLVSGSCPIGWGISLF